MRLKVYLEIPLGPDPWIFVEASSLEIAMELTTEGRRSGLFVIADRYVMSTDGDRFTNLSDETIVQCAIDPFNVMAIENVPRGTP